eukprot:COSAG01_NODE_6904_length_3445_cov_3.883465_3_plen_87_part_00
MCAAREHNLNIIGVKEEDIRFGLPDFALERQRALTGGKDEGPVHEQALENIRLLDQVCFIPRRTQAHETNAMLAEIVRQGIENAKA